MGQIFKQMGNTEAALQSYRQAQKLLAQDSTHSNILMCLNYSDSANPEAVFQEYQRWGKRYGNQHAGKRKFTNISNTERQLRIGYVSADFREHPVAWFLEPTLTRHDRKMFHITCYSAVAIPDQTTGRLRGLVDEWRNIFNQSDEQVIQQIKNDSIDILVDLSGHSAGNRLKVFAQKPAPVQVTYLGYPNTTGVHTINYRLTDSWADPPGMTERYHCEKLVRLPQGFLCYSPHPDAPEVSPSPFANNGHITFGSFNNLAKIMPTVVAAWAAILKRLPDARLLIKAYSFIDPDTRESYLAQFNDAGVDTNVLNCVAQSKRCQTISVCTGK
jgi:protein O-GlcNAc transferase